MTQKHCFYQIAFIYSSCVIFQNGSWRIFFFGIDDINVCDNDTAGDVVKIDEIEGRDEMTGEDDVAGENVIVDDDGNE